MTTMLLPLALVGFAGLAQGQEYQNQHTIYAPGFKQTTYEDGSKTTTTWRVNNATGQITDVETIRTHATPAPVPTPAPVFVPYVNTDFNHDGHAFDQVTAPQAAPAPTAPVIVTSGPDATAQMRAAAIAGAARVKAQAAAEAAQRKNWKAFKNGE